MSHAAKKNDNAETEPVRVLGRGLRARRGVKMTLRAIRDATGLTQVALAEKSAMDQGDISRLENRPSLEDCQLATLQRYIAAVGGEFELTARFGDKRLTIVGVTTTEDV